MCEADHIHTNVPVFAPLFVHRGTKCWDETAAITQPNRHRAAWPVWCPMGNKSSTSGQSKKPGRSLKEKRVAKHAKQDAQAASRKALEK